MQVDPSQYSHNANLFFKKVEDMAREVLGREYKRHLNKGNLIKECERYLLECFEKKHVELFGSTFLNRWLKNYLYYFSAEIYQSVNKAVKDSQTCTVYSDAFIGQFCKEFVL